MPPAFPLQSITIASGCRSHNVKHFVFVSDHAPCPEDMYLGAQAEESYTYSFYFVSYQVLQQSRHFRSQYAALLVDDQRRSGCGVVVGSYRPRPTVPLELPAAISFCQCRTSSR